MASVNVGTSHQWVKFDHCNLIMSNKELFHEGHYTEVSRQLHLCLSTWGPMSFAPMAASSEDNWELSKLSNTT